MVKGNLLSKLKQNCALVGLAVGSAMCDLGHKNQRSQYKNPSPQGEGTLDRYSAENNPESPPNYVVPVDEFRAPLPDTGVADLDGLCGLAREVVEIGGERYRVISEIGGDIMLRKLDGFSYGDNLGPAINPCVPEPSALAILALSGAGVSQIGKKKYNSPKDAVLYNSK